MQLEEHILILERLRGKGTVSGRERWYILRLFFGLFFGLQQGASIESAGVGHILHAHARKRT